MFKRPYYIAVAILAVLTLLVLNLPSQTTARLKTALGSVFLPLFGMADGTKRVAGRTADTLLPKSELIAANDALRRQNQDLRLQLAQADTIAKENDRLRQLVGWQKQNRWNAKLARVIYRDPANWWRTIQIDMGSRNGLSNKLAVLSPDGFLIGHVSSVSPTKSQVVLIGDANCRVPAVVENETRSQGIVVGSGPFDGSFANLTHLPSNATLKPGQRVVTSSYSSIYPPGIQIGLVVEEAHLVDSGLIQEADVKLSANLNSLEEVWILFP
ncbi:MAG: rod shape-determining protein MreC [Verrucomicrobiota bacterium]